jgi:hypothetical protein
MKYLAYNNEQMVKLREVYPNKYGAGIRIMTTHIA